MSEGPWAKAKSVGSWTWLIARCWWPSWIQRALQLLQMAIGYRPKPMVTRADRHSGQRGMRTPRTAGADLGAVGRGLLGLGHQDLEHAVLERGLDLLGHRMGGQGDGAAEGAVA